MVLYIIHPESSCVQNCHVTSGTPRNKRHGTAALKIERITVDDPSEKN